MKRHTINIFLCLILTFGLASCNSFLDRNSLRQENNDDFFSTENNANAAVIGMYRTMTSSFTYGQSMLIVPEFSAKHVRHVSIYPEYENFSQHKLPADNAWVTNMWQGIYISINAANNIIGRVPEMTEGAITKEKSAQFVGEAKFVRALNYFFLVRAFGKVPLKLTYTTEVNNAASEQSTVEATYTQIIKDLTEAAAALPEGYNGDVAATKGRATKYAALGLLAKAYLYQAAITKDYSKAASIAASLIQANQFPLVADFKSIWQSENSSESIFELQFDSQTTNPLALVANNNASILFYVNDTVVSKLFESKDKRLAASVIRDTSALAYMGKFPNFNPPTQNVPLLRMAEVYLIHAEAQAQVDQAVTDASYNSFKAIYTRAGLTKNKADFNSLKNYITAIQEEKERELLFEGETWFDFCRTELALEKYATLDNKAYFLYPIPTAQIAINKKLIQNPGY